MKISAKIIAHSITQFGQEIVSFELVYPRWILAEVNTHRTFSRSSMSSRAIPVAKMLEQVRNDPAWPVAWGSNKPGMQAGEPLGADEQVECEVLWEDAAATAADYAEKLSKLGLAKQLCNRILEPFQWMRTIVTATDLDNFYALRCHPDAQPEFQALAWDMRESHKASVPVLRSRGDGVDGWHLPYVTEAERKGARDSQITGAVWALCKLSAARCARVSYNKHDGTPSTIEEDLALFQRLAGSTPIHASPLEMQACAMTVPGRSRNFSGWRQFRELFEETNLV